MSDHTFKDDELNEIENNEIDQITLTLEDDSELVCDILAIFPVEDKEYIALLPQYPKGHPDADNGDIFLYGFVDKGDDIELIDIEDEDEFDRISDAFDEYMDSAEFDEMFGEDEEEE